MDTKGMKLKIVKKILVIIGYLLILLLLLILPLGVEGLIREGICGYTFPNTIFSNDQWFAFWGSYIGAIITVIVLFATIRYNKLETLKMLKDYEHEMQYNRRLKNLEEIHNYINLCYPSGELIENNYIIYVFRMMDKRYFELMNECEPICSEYIGLVKQIFYEYLLEAKKVPETLNEIEIVDAAEIYKSVTKKIISIKHKYVQQEALLYDKAVKEVEGSRVSKKRRIFDN